jgi:hypothetical protein
MCPVTRPIVNRQDRWRQRQQDGEPGEPRVLRTTAFGSPPLPVMVPETGVLESPLVLPLREPVCERQTQSRPTAPVSPRAMERDG